MKIGHSSGLSLLNEGKPISLDKKIPTYQNKVSSIFIKIYRSDLFDLFFHSKWTSSLYSVSDNLVSFKIVM